MMSIKIVLTAIVLWMTSINGPWAPTASPGTITKQPPENATAPILYNWIPDGTPMADIRGMNAQSYVIVYSDIFPDRGESGVLNTQTVIRALEKQISNTYSGWGVLDFEGEIFDRLFHEPINDKFEITTESLINTIRAVKKRWPKAKWTYWGMPDLKFWIHIAGEKPTTWATANETQKTRALNRAQKGFMAIAEEVDWISPWIYDLYLNEQFSSANEKQSMINAQREWALAKCKLCRTISNSRSGGPIPVIPMFCPMFAPGGNIATKTFVSEEEFRTDILEPVVKSGVDGLSTWNELGFRVSNAFRSAINQHQVGIRNNSRKVLSEILFEDDSFNWNSENAKRLVNDAIRPILMTQLRMMRSELDDFGPHSPAPRSSEPSSNR